MVDIYKTRKELWIDDNSVFITWVDIYNADNIKIISLKVPDNYAERIYASMLLLMDNISITQGMQQIDLPISDTRYRYSILLTRESDYVNFTVMTFDVISGKRKNIIWIPMDESEVMAFANAIYDAYDILLEGD